MCIFSRQLSDAITKSSLFDTSTRKMLDNIAKEAGACKHFCPSKWAKVGGMLQVMTYYVVVLPTITWQQRLVP